MALMIEYAISLGIQEREGLWLIRYPNPLVQNSVQSLYVPKDRLDGRIGTTIDGIKVVKPGEKLAQVIVWLENRVTKYPYYWDWEGKPVDRFGYDFVAQQDTAGSVNEIEITLLAYDIVRQKIEVKIPGLPAEVTQNTETLEAGGVYVKLQIVLERPSPVSEIALNPFTQYPMEIVSIMYEEDTETYHPRKELVVKKISASTQTMIVKFPAVVAKRFTIIIRQKNYVKNSYMVRATEMNKKTLWDKISNREAVVTLDLGDNGIETVQQNELNEYSKWNEYLESRKEFYNELAEWKKDLEAYQLYRKKLKEKQDADAAYKKAMDGYRAEFKKARDKYDKQLKSYQDKMKQYEAEKAKYDRELASYNQRLRDLQNWQKKWG